MWAGARIITWLRSGNDNNTNNAASLSSDGSLGWHWVSDSRAVRPAIQLNNLQKDKARRNAVTL